MHRRLPLGPCLVVCTLLASAGCAPISALDSHRSFVRPAPAEAQPPSGAQTAPDAVDEDQLMADVGALDAMPTLEPSPTPLPSSTPLPTPTVPPTSTPDPLAASGSPVRLQIPAIGVDAFVERVGLTTDNAMDVPAGWQNVGWYMPGHRPGEAGNAVIAGHLDNSSGGPAVFWDLALLSPGDEVTVTYENGDQFTFMVQDSAQYQFDADVEVINRVFGDAPTPNLNLITCQGIWDRNKATYSERLVVFTSLMPERTVRANGQGAYD